MQNLSKQLKNKIINRILTLEKVQGDYQSFFPILHIDGRNSLIIEPFINSENSDASKVVQVLQDTERLFFTYREID